MKLVNILKEIHAVTPNKPRLFSSNSQLMIWLKEHKEVVLEMLSGYYEPTPRDEYEEGEDGDQQYEDDNEWMLNDWPIIQNYNLIYEYEGGDITFRGNLQSGISFSYKKEVEDEAEVTPVVLSNVIFYKLSYNI